MTTIEEFIEDRLSEDEAVAREADRTRWLPEDKGVTFEFADIESDYSGRVTADTKANMNQIARHDPARVLRQVAALRATVRHATTHDSATERDALGEDVLGPIAAIWFDHPDYRQEWASAEVP